MFLVFGLGVKLLKNSLGATNEVARVKIQIEVACVRVDKKLSELLLFRFIDQITNKSGRAARIESHGAYYTQATHLQTKFKVI